MKGDISRSLAYDEVPRNSIDLGKFEILAASKGEKGFTGSCIGLLGENARHGIVSYSILNAMGCFRKIR